MEKIKLIIIIILSVTFIIPMVNSERVPTDCDLNEKIDIFDLAIMRDIISRAAYHPGCDGNADGTINIFDLAILRVALQTGTNPIPEYQLPQESNRCIGLNRGALEDSAEFFYQSRRTPTL